VTLRCCECDDRRWRDGLCVTCWVRAADHDSENAQAAREIASLSHGDDPEPGAFYGLTDLTAPEPTTYA
jgi:hypothetical protein